MSTFNGKTITKLAVPDPRTDHTLPKSRSLSFKEITQHTAVRGTKGQHCNLVHGDHWHEVIGNETNRVRVDQDTTVTRNQKNLIQGNHKETITGRCYQNIIGPHVTQDNAVRNETYLGKVTQIWGKNEKVNTDAKQQAVREEDFEFVDVAVAIHNFDLSVVGLGLAVYAWSTYLAVWDMALTLISAELHASHSENHLTHTEVHCGKVESCPPPIP